MSLPRIPGPDEAVIQAHTSVGTLGPMSRRTLADKVHTGEVERDDHFWFDGMTDWLEVGAHPELLEDLGTARGAPAKLPGENDDDYYDRMFGSLVQGSWDYTDDHVFSGHIDEVFLGAVITSTLDTGYVLIDLTSDGRHHYLRFENLETHARIIFQLTHLTPSLTDSRVLGQRASVVIGYGEKIGNISKIMKAIRAEYKSGYISKPEPGTISVDGDMNSGYVYVEVDLFLPIDDYIGRNYDIDYAKLSTHVAGTTHALRKYLRGRFA